MAFNLRDFEDEKKAKLGVSECVNHKLIDPYQVLYEKPTEIVAQYKFTVLLMPSGSHKITGLPVNLDQLQSEYQVEDEEIKVSIVFVFAFNYLVVGLIDTLVTILNGSLFCFSVQEIVGDFR